MCSTHSVRGCLASAPAACVFVSPAIVPWTHAARERGPWQDAGAAACWRMRGTSSSVHPGVVVRSFVVQWWCRRQWRRPWAADLLKAAVMLCPGMVRRMGVFCNVLCQNRRGGGPAGLQGRQDAACTGATRLAGHRHTAAAHGRHAHEPAHRITRKQGRGWQSTGPLMAALTPMAGCAQGRGW